MKTKIRSLILSLALCGSTWQGAAAALERESVGPLAVEIAYRLDRELGQIEGAQRHLLIWRMTDALTSGEFAPGAALSRQVLEWQHQLETLKPPAQPLPAWFAPQVPDTLSALLLARAASLEYAPWNLPRRLATASAAAKLVTGAGPQPWVAAQQPHHLAWARDHGPVIWVRFLTFLADNPDWLPLVTPAIANWTPLPVDAPLQQWRALPDAAAAELRGLAPSPGDPFAALVAAEADLLLTEELLIDRRDSSQLRLAPYRLFRLGGQDDAFERSLISLARAVRGIERGGFAELVQVLLGIAEIALLDPQTVDAARLQSVLESLRRIDPVVLEMFEAVDLRLLTVYQQVRKLLRDQASGSGPPADEGLRLLASLHAAHGLDASDLEGYLSQPVRARAETDLLVCFDASRDRPPYPQEPITPNQFERCLEDFFDWAVVQAARLELAGRPGGPFEREHLARELELSPWQRINYWFGLLGSRLGGDCAADSGLVNPLEWGLAARAYVRFAHRWPAYYVSRNRSPQLTQLRDAGEAVLASVAQLRHCARQGQGPPLVYLMGEYAQALTVAAEAIGRESARFRETWMKPNADVDLAADAWQRTNYRPESLMIGPCGAEPSCDMGDSLPPSRALLSLFPQPYLVADQIRLGDVSLCYANVRWVDRRAELPAVRNQAMARYFGRLSFDLQGLYSGSAEPIFSMRLTSADEYEYLFAENSEAVLGDPCPRHLIGSQVRSQLPERRIELVPRRLTFMTADRMHPAKVFQAHWAAGNEWRDRFVTGQGVEVLSKTGPEPIIGAVDSRLSDLYRNRNRSVYEALLDERGAGGEPSPIYRSMQDVDRIKQMVATFAKLLVPDRLVFDSAVRAGVLGERGLFDRNRVLSLRQQGVPVDQLVPLVLSHFEDTRYLFSHVSERNEAQAGTDRIILGTLLEIGELEGRY